jgi:hypothetical protein
MQNCARIERTTCWLPDTLLKLWNITISVNVQIKSFQTILLSTFYVPITEVGYYNEMKYSLSLHYILRIHIYLLDKTSYFLGRYHNAPFKGPIY